MSFIQDIAAPADPRGFHDRIYAGEILCFRQVPAMAALVAETRRMLEEAFGEPTRVHERLGHAAQVERFTALQRDFRRSERARGLWQELFRALGLAPEGLAHDKLFLRFQPPLVEDREREAATAPLAFHRDTWGSNLYAQVNWWAPVRP